MYPFNIPSKIAAPIHGLNMNIQDDCSKISWSQYRYLALDLEGLENHTHTIHVDFYTKYSTTEYALRIRFSILPHIRCVVPIDLQILDSQHFIIPRTASRLRMLVYGKPIRPEEITQIKLGTLKCYKEQEINLYAMYLTKSLPDTTRLSSPLVDSMGQWMDKHWEDKITTEESMCSRLHQLYKQAQQTTPQFPGPDWDEFGGWKQKHFEATGWFRIVKDENSQRFWLADPLGNAFISTGIDCINPGINTRVDFDRLLLSWLPDSSDTLYEDCWDTVDTTFDYGIANLIRAFGKEHWKEAFSTITRHYLYKWHCNTIGNWSSIQFAKWAKLPYVIPLDAQGTEFPTTSKFIFRDFPDVFDPEYEANAAKYAQNILPYVDDPYLVGYFMRNEPSWGFVYDLLIAEEMLESDEDFISKQVFIDRMKEKYQHIGTMNNAWNINLSSFDELKQPIRQAASLSPYAHKDLKDFSSEMIRRYVSIPALAIRALDPNHLNLGMRYAYITDPVMLSGHEYFDVFSINLYQMSPYEEVQTLGNLIQMPIMIGEFHFGALDKGLLSTGLRGVANQTERGKAYRYYMEQGMKSPYFLGAHYFQLADQSCLGRFDGENYQIGLTDIMLQEYQEMTAIMTECNKRLYQIADGIIKPANEEALIIPAVHC